MAILFFIFAAMFTLAPGRDHSELGTAIAKVVLEEPPLFKGDESRIRTASLMTAIAFRESSFRNAAIGDHGHALCAFQLWDTPRDVLTDPELCTRIALQRMRQSIRACGLDNALGIYAAGPEGCSSPHAKRISNDRMSIAMKLSKIAP
jgi:hypothetical protein